MKYINIYIYIYIEREREREREREIEKGRKIDSKYTFRSPNRNSPTPGILGRQINTLHGGKNKKKRL